MPARRWSLPRLMPRDPPMPGRPKIGLTSLTSSWTARICARCLLHRSTVHTDPLTGLKLRGEDCGALDAPGATGLIDSEAPYDQSGYFKPSELLQRTVRPRPQRAFAYFPGEVSAARGHRLGGTCGARGVRDRRCWNKRDRSLDRSQILGVTRGSWCRLEPGLRPRRPVGTALSADRARRRHGADLRAAPVGSSQRRPRHV